MTDLIVYAACGTLVVLGITLIVDGVLECISDLLDNIRK